MKKFLFLACLWLGAVCAYPAEAILVPSPGSAPEVEVDRKIAPGDTVLIEVFNEPSLSVERRVQKSGTILYPLLQLVSLAGKTPGEAAVDLQESLSKDFLVNPQVSVTVKEYAARTVTITGHVLRPSSYPLPGEIKWRIVEAIGIAGGISPRGNADKIKFTRRGKSQIFKWETLQKEDPDKAIVLEPGDLIEVPEKFF